MGVRTVTGLQRGHDGLTKLEARDFQDWEKRVGILRGENLVEAGQRLGRDPIELFGDMFDAVLGPMFARDKRLKAARLRTERKAEREVRLKHIEEMEALGYEVTGSEPGDKLTWKKKVEDEAAENLTELQAWARRRGHAL
jgi:hypothetical protein